MQRQSVVSRRGYRKEKKWQEKLKDFARNFIAFMFSNVGIIGLVVGYTILGSFVFMYIEGERFESSVKHVVTEREKLTSRLWQITCCEQNTFSEKEWKDIVEVELFEFQETVVDACQKLGYEGEEQTVNHWSFSGAFLYSLTVITTIGYGNLTPNTGFGKFATIVYAIVGLPLFLLYLSNIGFILGSSFKWIYAKCCLCRDCNQRRQRLAEMRELAERGIDLSLEETNDMHLEDPEQTTSEAAKSVTVPITLCLAMIVGYVYGGAVLFSNWENWDLLDGAYFCFISLSTIGFGDIVPGDVLKKEEGSEMKFIFCAVYLLLGMAIIAMCFNLMQEEVVHKLRIFVDSARNIVKCNR